MATIYDLIFVVRGRED